jgi:hypothetical protein
LCFGQDQERAALQAMLRVNEQQAQQYQWQWQQGPNWHNLSQQQQLRR